MTIKVKFRVWNTANNEFDYSDSPDSSCYLIALNGRLKDGNGNPYDENHVIQQFTGMTDNNGKDIYVGDILKVKGYSGLFDEIGHDYLTVVTFSQGRFVTKTAKVLRDAHHQDYIGQDIFRHEFREITGNIFENQELLA